MFRRVLALTLILLACFVLLAGGNASAAPLPAADGPAPVTTGHADQWSESLTLTPTDDTYIYSGEPDTSFGDSPELKLFNGQGDYAALLMKFDDTGIPETAWRYRLRLAVVENYGVYERSPWAYTTSPFFDNSTVPWTEDDLTWNNSRIQSHGGFTDPVVQPTLYGMWMEWDVTDVVVAHGMKTFEVGHNQLVFSSKEGEFPPQLIVDYYVEPPAIHTLTPTDDAYVKQKLPKVNFGAEPDLHVREATKDERSFLKFDLHDLSDVKRATLRLYAGGANRGSTLYVAGLAYAGTSTPWQEEEVNWQNAPLIGPSIGWLTETSAAGWVEVDVTAAALSAPQKTLSLGLLGHWSRVSTFSSKEGAYPPQLVVETGGGTIPPPVRIFYAPTNDAYVMESRPTKVYGARKTLNVRNAARGLDTYVKFNMIGATGTIERATLLLYVTNGGPDGGQVYAVSPTYPGTNTQWLETDLTWRNAPPISGAPIGSIGPVAARNWVVLDVTDAAREALLNNNGRLSLAIHNNSTNQVAYSSKEGVELPELIVEMTP